MQRFSSYAGTIAPLYRPNIDTDQIIPKQFLKRIERTGYGKFLFYDWRYDSDGTPVADFVLNDPRFAGAGILVAGPNFGCGSSREHAPWSLMDFGFRVIIAPSYADIFHNNSLKNGLLPIALGDADCAGLARRAELDPKYSLTIDLANQSVAGADDFCRAFEIDPFRKHCILEGLDDVALTLEHEDKISDYEHNRAAAVRYSYLTV